MLKFNLQFFGGRGANSSGSSGGSQLARQSFGGASMNEASTNYINTLKFRANSHESADEKYSQVEDMAKGRNLNYYANEVVRTQAFDHASSEYTSKNTRGKSTGWKITQENGKMVNGHTKLYGDLGPSAQKSLKNSIQKQAQQWLKKHPKPSASERKNYRWNGTEYVKR